MVSWKGPGHPGFEPVLLEAQTEPPQYIPLRVLLSSKSFYLEESQR